MYFKDIFEKLLIFLIWPTFDSMEKVHLSSLLFLRILNLVCSSNRASLYNLRSVFLSSSV